MTIDEVLRRLKNEPNLLAVSKETGIPYASVWSYARGRSVNPGARHIDTLRKHYQRGK